MKDKKRKRIFRMPPCPAYDITGLEQWLEEMAAQGYVLKRFFTSLIAVFEQQEPQNLRYRMTSLSSDAFAFPDLDPSLDHLKEYCSAYGWEYAGHRGSFCIFVTGDPSARELHTDTDVQAMIMEQVRKERKSSLILPALWLGYIVVKMLCGEILLNTIRLGSVCVLLFLIIVLMFAVDAFLELRHLRKIQNAVSEGVEVEKKRNAAAYQARTIFLMAAVLLLIVMAGAEYYSEAKGKNEIPLASYTEEIPTLTIQNLVPGDTWIETDQSEYANRIIAKSDLLAPVYVSFSQNGAVYEDGLCKFEGMIDVTYMETRSPWIAERVAKDFQARDEKMWNDRYEVYEPLNLPELGADYAAAWKHLLPAFVIADGSKVVYVYYYQSSGGEELTLEEITKMYADNMKQ